jgi:hypothetical protein
MGGFGILAFLLSISGNQYLNELTITAMIHLFDTIKFVPLATHMIDSIFLNLKLWVFTPIPFQLLAYRLFYAALHS